MTVAQFLLNLVTGNMDKVTDHNQPGNLSGNNTHLNVNIGINAKQEVTQTSVNGISGGAALAITAGVAIAGGVLATYDFEGKQEGEAKRRAAVGNLSPKGIAKEMMAWK